MWGAAWGGLRRATAAGCLLPRTDSWGGWAGHAPVAPRTRRRPRLLAGVPGSPSPPATNSGTRPAAEAAAGGRGSRSVACAARVGRAFLRLPVRLPATPGLGDRDAAFATTPASLRSPRSDSSEAVPRTLGSGHCSCCSGS